MDIKGLDSTTTMVKEEHQATSPESERKELCGLWLFVSATAIVTDPVVKEGRKKELLVIPTYTGKKMYELEAPLCSI